VKCFTTNLVVTKASIVPAISIQTCRTLGERSAVADLRPERPANLDLRGILSEFSDHLVEVAGNEIKWIGWIDQHPGAVSSHVSSFRAMAVITGRVRSTASQLQQGARKKASTWPESGW
jgi:hypothetical protein